MTHRTSSQGLIEHLKKRYRYKRFLLVAALALFSCAYFNTFYNAKTDYEKALKIIQETPMSSDSNIPSQAVTLLNESIDNAKLVIKEFPDSKYIDDSYFLIGKCSFLLNRYPEAKRNLMRVIDNFPESVFLEESEILLAYTLFRMGYENESKSMIDNFSKDIYRKRKNTYLIRNLEAEFQISNNNYNQCYELYLDAIDNASDKSEKIAVLSKLISISKEREDFDRLVEYLDMLSDVSTGNNRVNAKLDWVEFQLERGEYKLLISELENMLLQSEFDSKKLSLEILLAKAYMLYGNHDRARNLLLDITDEYQRKNETAEAYYYLGNIELDGGFDLDVAREYFDLSIKERSSSKYGRLSKVEKKKIDSFLDMYEDLNLVRLDSNDDPETEEDAGNGKEKSNTNGENKMVDFGIDIELDFPDNDIGPADSLLIAIAESLVFDFNKYNRSIDIYKEIVDKYPESKYRAQALYALSVYDKSPEWKIELAQLYPGSNFTNSSSSQSNKSASYTLIDSLRDVSWQSMSESYIDGYENFYNLYLGYNDTLSLYYAGYIADHFINDFSKAMTDYKTIISRYPDFSHYSDINNRIDVIRNEINSQIAIIDHQIEFRKAIYFLYENNVDSAKIYLSNSKSGIGEGVSSAARKKYNDILRLDSVNREIAAKDTSAISDSTMFVKAEIFNSLFMEDSASSYYRKIIASPKSKYRDRSKVRLDRLFPSEGLLDDIAFDPDSVLLELENIMLPENINIIMDNNYKDKQDRLLDRYLGYLSILPDDSLRIMEDNINEENVPIGPSMK